MISKGILPGEGDKTHQMTDIIRNNSLEDIVLLLLLPFWTPLIPPLGISCLKSYLSSYGQRVKTYDANIEPQFKDLYNQYFLILKDIVPENKRGNFYNTGHDVLRNHLMSYLNQENQKEHFELVRFLVSSYFFCDIESLQIMSLDEVLTRFYGELENYLLKILTVQKPAVFGLSVYSGTLAPSLFAFKLIKEICPKTLTVMGGGIFADQLAAGSPDLEIFIKKTPFIDKIIIGEGEVLFLQLLRKQLPESQKVYTINDIQGRMLELSKAEIPDFSDFKLDRYSQLAGFASRSCPFQCNFCTETRQWGEYRCKPVKQVVQELLKLYQKYHCQLFLLGDSLINPLITELARELVDMETSIYWDGYLRVDQSACNLENTLLWRQGGFYRARMGIESGSPRILKLMNKKITIDQIKLALYNLAQLGIKTTTYWVIGYPGETESDFQQSLDLIMELKDYIYEAEANPFQYYLNGQVGAGYWSDNYQIKLLYPEELSKMLLIQTRVICCEPAREVIYRRICSFAEHCSKFGIPNPYFLRDIYYADQRWLSLHKNSVPPIIEFKNNQEYISENKRVNRLLFATKSLKEDSDFNF